MRGEGKQAKQRLLREQQRLHRTVIPFQAVVDAISGGTVTLQEDGIPFDQPAAKIKGVLIEQGDLVLVAPIGESGEEFVVIGTIDDGSIPTELELPAQIRSIGATPSVSALAAAGSSATVSITGTDTAGMVQLVPGGSGIASGSVLTITFSSPRANGNYFVGLTPNSNAARAVTNIGPASRSSVSFSLTVGAALTSGSTYQWLFFVVGY